MSDTDNWSVKATSAAIDAFDAHSGLDLETDKGPGLAIWHLLVGMRELCALQGIDFDDIQKDAAREFRNMVDNGSILVPAPAAPTP